MQWLGYKDKNLTEGCFYFPTYFLYSLQSLQFFKKIFQSLFYPNNSCLPRFHVRFSDQFPPTPFLFISTHGFIDFKIYFLAWNKNRTGEIQTLGPWLYRKSGFPLHTNCWHFHFLLQTFIKVYPLNLKASVSCMHSNSLKHSERNFHFSTSSLFVHLDSTIYYNHQQISYS